ncbi:hypothetical protein [Rhizobium leguminosarum]
MAINGGFGLWFRELNEVSIGDNSKPPGVRVRGAIVRAGEVGQDHTHIE